MKITFFNPALLLAIIALPAAATAYDRQVPVSVPAVEHRVQLTLYPEMTLKAGQPVRVIASLTIGGKPLTAEELTTVHTQKFHLLVIDPTLTDYQHLHPEPTPTPGNYRFTFTPKFDGGYRAWADVTPSAIGDQQFAAADLDTPAAPKVDAKESLQAVYGNYLFTLSFDEPPHANYMVMARLNVIDKEGKPVQTLEPVMGAFAHMVGFYPDYVTVLHTHPMGDEPAASALGGPELMFHMGPTKPGFLKLFAQVKIGGQDIFVPFGVNIAE